MKITEETTFGEVADLKKRYRVAHLLVSLHPGYCAAEIICDDSHMYRGVATSGELHDALSSAFEQRAEALEFASATFKPITPTRND